MDGVRIGAAIGELFVNAIHGIRNIASNTPFGEQPAQGKKWGPIQVWSDAKNRYIIYIYEMRQVHIEDFFIDVGKHLIDGLNFEVATSLFKPSKFAKSSNRSMNNVEARVWYLSQEAKISTLINSKLPLEQQAKQAFNLRNALRTMARNLMSDVKEVPN